MDISLVVAVAEGGVIGHRNRLPWHLPKDLRRFRALTLGKPVLMGRRTFESIGRPLPGRQNLVLSADPAYARPGVLVVHSIEAALAAAGAAEELMVIGGARLYRELLPRARRLYLTEVLGRFEGDVFFPEVDEAEWVELACEEEPADERHAVAHRFRLLERRGPPRP